jgi:hypothetical protein
MSALDLQSFDAILKAHYTDKRVEDMVYQDNPFLAMVPKNPNGGGKYEVIPLKFGNTVGTSATFSAAQANKGASKYNDFLVTRVKYYSLADIDNETQLASKGNAKAFLEAATSEINSAIDAASRDIAISLFGDQSGDVGLVGGISGEVITLSEISQITNFEVGKKVVFADDTTSANLRGSASEIVAIDRIAGKFTLATGGVVASGVQSGDYIFFDGDHTNANKTLKLAGLKAWLPDTAPTSTPFFGVDRSVDVTRLGGLRENYSAAPIEEALIDMAYLISREGGRPDVCFVSFEKYAELIKAMGSKVQFIDLKATASIGFTGVQIIGPKGPIRVVPDQNCPNNRAYMLTMKTWQMISLGQAPQLLQTDGLRVMRNAASDSVEVRVGAYANLACHAPGHNGVLKF